jgi:hypothetical protein
MHTPVSLTTWSVHCGTCPFSAASTGSSSTTQVAATCLWSWSSHVMCVWHRRWPPQAGMLTILCSLLCRVFDRVSERVTKARGRMRGGHSYVAPPAVDTFGVPHCGNRRQLSNVGYTRTQLGLLGQAIGGVPVPMFCYLALPQCAHTQQGMNKACSCSSHKRR